MRTCSPRPAGRRPSTCSSVCSCSANRADLCHHRVSVGGQRPVRRSVSHALWLITLANKPERAKLNYTGIDFGLFYVDLCNPSVLHTLGLGGGLDGDCGNERSKISADLRVR